MSSPKPGAAQQEVPSEAGAAARRARGRREQVGLRLRHLGRAISLVWKAAPGWTTAWLALLLLQGLLPVAIVYLTRAVVDGVVEILGIGASWTSIRPVLLPAAGMAGVLVLSELSASVTGWIRTAQAEAVRDRVSDLVHQQSAAVDLRFYETSEYYDHLHRARDEASQRPLTLVEGLGGLLQNGVTLLAMVAVLIPFGLWLPLALLASTAPALYVVLMHGRLRHAWHVRRTGDQRRARYIEALLTFVDNAAELRLFDLGGVFRERYRSVRASLRKDEVALARRQAAGELLAGGFALLVTAGAMLWMIWRAAQGVVSLGDLALFYQAFHQGQRLLRTSLESLGRVYSNALFLGDLYEFLGLESTLTSPLAPTAAPAGLAEGIRFDGVTFRYPGRSEPALSDFDLFLPAGMLGAVVGPNGAGKSTLLKLLCRFYDPERGRILVDGVDLREFELSEARRLVSALFQEPVHYNETVADNIGFSDLPARNDEERLHRAATLAEAEELVARLPRAYETLLGRRFEDGIELSVGEWQRIALARAFFREAPILLLDEPTSAMDAWSEVAWMLRLRSSVADRTSLVVTHRFTTAMRTDVIFVVDDGRVIEQGTHEELLQQGGSYARSWRDQTSNASPDSSV